MGHAVPGPFGSRALYAPSPHFACRAPLCDSSSFLHHPPPPSTTLQHPPPPSSTLHYTRPLPSHMLALHDLRRPRRQRPLHQVHRGLHGAGGATIPLRFTASIATPTTHMPVRLQVLPLYGNTHTTTSVTGSQSTAFRCRLFRQLSQRCVAVLVQHFTQPTHVAAASLPSRVVTDPPGRRRVPSYSAASMRARNTQYSSPAAAQPARAASWLPSCGCCRSGRRCPSLLCRRWNTTPTSCLGAKAARWC